MSTPCFQGLDSLAMSVAIWQQQHGRHNLPWQGSTDAYRIWLSEIMLQQTQVTTVMAYYTRFLERFPTVADLAAAALDDVMPYWAGLGYYARARNLHRCAQVVQSHYGGRFPSTSTELATLPGIGPSTAAAIAAFAFGERSPIMDGNVKRVFTRYFGIFGDPTRRAVENVLWDAARTAIDRAPDCLDIRRYTQGLMDLGATVCTRRNPDCDACPIRADCYARRHARQHDLPQSRARGTRPQRECTMLILEHDERILLQQQPSPGIWGGLWSLPRFDNASDLEAALNHWQVRPDRIHDLEPLVHGFSHFTLQILPRHIRTASATPTLTDAAATQIWTPIDRLPDTALPAPVKLLLDRLFPPRNLFPFPR